MKNCVYVNAVLMASNWVILDVVKSFLRKLVVQTIIHLSRRSLCVGRESNT